MARDRLYRRKGRSTWTADLREFGVGRVSTGETEYDAALQWLARKLGELHAPKAEREAARYRDGITLAHYAATHLERKAASRRPATVDRDRRSLGLPKGIVDAGGTLRFRTEPIHSENGFITWARERLRLDTVPLTAVSPRLLDEYVFERRQAGYAAQSILHDLHALSSLFERAMVDGIMDRNPVKLIRDRPVIRRDEPAYLEVDEAAALLQAAEGHTRGLIAVCLLTGARRAEAFGLEVSDVDLDAGLVRIGENRWRKLKRGGTRYVPLWPQLRTILREEADLARPGLLFPGPDGGVWVNLRRSFGTAVRAAGIEKDVSWVTLRHSYAAARLQTVEGTPPAPVSPYTVAKELGHGSLQMIERHYGHLLQGTRHRLPEVAYLTEEQREAAEAGARAQVEFQAETDEHVEAERRREIAEFLAESAQSEGD